jgi:small neutral amino acid transporter SnatA (MarC family)
MLFNNLLIINNVTSYPATYYMSTNTSTLPIAKSLVSTAPSNFSTTTSNSQHHSTIYDKILLATAAFLTAFAVIAIALYCSSGHLKRFLNKRKQALTGYDEIT